MTLARRARRQGNAGGSATGPERGASGPAPTGGAGSESGFALVAVLLVLAILGVIGAEFALSMRLEASMVRSYKDSLLAAHLAEAGVQQAIREILTDALLVGHPDDGPLTFHKTATQPLPRLPREKVSLGAGEFSYRISDEDARIDLNLASADKVDRLLDALGVDKRERDVIVDSIQDWKDSNEEHRMNGAESDDVYLTLPVPYRAHNANFEDVRELLQVRGVTPEIYYGHEGQPGLREFVTAHGGAQVNMNTASEPVLRAHGLSDAEISYVLQTRRTAPFATVPGQLGLRGLGIVSRTFRIEAEGRIADEPRARVTAIARKQVSQSTGGIEVVVLGWTANADEPPPTAAP